ncbi:hypothetical protein FOPG_14205 [Fusarium oxysporum f. sp. conglutinans race 2 54008]|uniref:Uncharacterized protein n=2 Tax=Fusarium oxysporum TaxID=5507 RepID=X0HDD3_FUSOX|nr:hypothetical protein FOVG_11261 [Fusarium oxysporum f. sp. pisi HDV247]EXL69906.1 hypothetical protein FOPG_14205 [Fusarium oxysporum f. sp. conglutinans race 2 54008]
MSVHNVKYPCFHMTPQDLFKGFWSLTRAQEIMTQTNLIG